MHYKPAEITLFMMDARTNLDERERLPNVVVHVSAQSQRTHCNGTPKSMKENLHTNTYS